MKAAPTLEALPTTVRAELLPKRAPLSKDWDIGLPRLMQPIHPALILKPEAAEEIKIMKGYREARMRADRSAHAFITARGGVGYWPPAEYEEGRTASLFAFNEAPANEDKAWSIMKKRARDNHVKASANLKKDTGRALAQAMAACVPYPSLKPLGARLNIIDNLTWEAGGGWGGSAVHNGFDPVRAAWTPDAFFLVIGNPIATIASLAERNKTNLRIIGQTYGGGQVEYPERWRPRAGWALVSQAEMELAFAEAKVAAERKR